MKYVTAHIRHLLHIKNNFLIWKIFHIISSSKFKIKDYLMKNNQPIATELLLATLSTALNTTYTSNTNKPVSILAKLLISVFNKFGNEITITVDDLRKTTNNYDTYPVFSDFRRYVIVHAIDELKNKNLADISYNPNKNGRNIESITFKKN